MDGASDFRFFFSIVLPLSKPLIFLMIMIHLVANWNAFFDAAQLGGQQSFIAWHPAPTRSLSALVASQPVDAWKDLLKLHLVAAYGAVLPKRIDDLNFAFFNKQLGGQQQALDGQRICGLRDRRRVVGVAAIALGQRQARVTLGHARRHVRCERDQRAGGLAAVGSAEGGGALAPALRPADHRSTSTTQLL